jgi:hypothetical protein
MHMKTLFGKAKPHGKLLAPPDTINMATRYLAVVMTCSRRLTSHLNE